MRRAFLGFGLYVLLSACIFEKEAQQKLEDAAIQLSEKNKFSSTYWLEMTSLIGWDRMILVFGYGENQLACQEIKQFFEKNHANRDYRCVAAN